jgi:recombination protein RecA
VGRPKKTEVKAPAPKSDTNKIVEDAIKKISKEQNTQFIRLGETKQEMRLVLPTDIFEIDHMIVGAGGFPRGRISEVYGIASGGKGTLLSQLIATTQRMTPKDEIAYIDAEHSFDPTYAAKLGVDTDRLLLAQPDCGEEALQAAIDIISTGKVRLALIDSVAALVPRAELEGSVSDAHMGQQARMLGQALRKMTAITSKTKTAVVFTNQLRQNLGVTFGNPNTTPGGKALGFFASLRLSVTRLSQIKKGDVNVGNLTKIKGEKNKTAPPFREASLDLLFDLPQNYAPGFDKYASLANAAIQQGIWKQEGALYTLASTGEQVRGKDNVRDALRDDEKVRRITTEATLVALGKSPEYIKRTMNG